MHEFKENTGTPFTTNIGTLCNNFPVTIMMHSCIELMMIERVERERMKLMMSRTNKIG